MGKISARKISELNNCGVLEQRFKEYHILMDKFIEKIKFPCVTCSNVKYIVGKTQLIKACEIECEQLKMFIQERNNYSELLINALSLNVLEDWKE